MDETSKTHLDLVPGAEKERLVHTDALPAS